MVNLGGISDPYQPAERELRLTRRVLEVEVITGDLIQWLLESDEPWTRYRTLVDLLGQPEEDADVQTARAEMLAHPQVRALIAEAATWPGYALKRHNDARHPIHKFSTLADFSVRASDAGTALRALEGLADGIESILIHQSAEGAFETQIRLYKRFGGMDGERWTWMVCDAPTLLYALLAFGLGGDPRVQRAVNHLAGLADENGWRCVVAPELGKFKGPGRREDPCPIANVYALKALSLVPELRDSPVTRNGAEMLLRHWERRTERKIYLFGIGTDFGKLKYPFVWYDILHIADVLSRFCFVHTDPRFREMVETVTIQADGDGRYAASSMYRAWKGWSFADKKQPSPWLTFLVLRLVKRVGETGGRAV